MRFISVPFWPLEERGFLFFFFFFLQEPKNSIHFSLLVNVEATQARTTEIVEDTSGVIKESMCMQVFC